MNKGSLSSVAARSAQANNPSAPPKIIFFGNGPLADATKATFLKNGIDIIFHARKKSDLEKVKTLKLEKPDAFGVLASFGVIIKSDILQLFEPTGIINLHPSLLPKYRGPSPIETAILNGDTTFGVSLMKLVKEMDAGPIFYQKTLNFDETTPKITIYEQLAITGAEWLSNHLTNLPSPVPQILDTTSPKSPDMPSTKSPNEPTTKPNSSDTNTTPTPSYTKKLSPSDAPLTPDTKTAKRLYNEIRAYKNFPKSRYTFFNRDCIILEAHISDTPELLGKNTPSPDAKGVSSPDTKGASSPDTKRASSPDTKRTSSPDAKRTSSPDAKNASSPLSLKCKDGLYLCIDKLQPAGKKPMDAKSFLNGYAR